MKVDSISIPRWFNRHYHPRDHDLLRLIIPYLLNQQATGAVVMGNLDPPDETSTIEKTRSYRSRIINAKDEAFFARETTNRDFNPRMTCYMTDQTSPEELIRGFKQGDWIGPKLYLADKNGEGGTTGSHSGVRDLLGRYPVFEVMEENRTPLLGHFEAAEKEVDEFDREARSLDRDLIPLLKAFPKLPVIVEHVTDSRMAEFVATAEYNIQATVTPHHLILNRNDMFWGGMSPLHYCKPVPKREKHRERVRQYVTSGHPRFGAGDDSAAHKDIKKVRYCRCAAGICHTNPVEMYATVFDEDNALEHLGPFLSENFLHLYGMEVSSEMMTIRREPLTIPEKIGTVHVFKGGEVLPWKLVG